MKLWYLAYRNLRSKPLNLALNLLLLVLSISLVTFIIQLSAQLKGNMDRNIMPFDMVVGAKGSPLQLVLSSVLHIDAPTGNIKLKEADEIARHPFVKDAVPVSYGDNFKGFRILGTQTSYFEKYNAKLGQGRYFQKPFEVVVGANVAKILGLNLGDVFTSSHGLAANATEVHDHHPFTVVGLLEATGTIVDQLLICDLESIWQAHSHETNGHADENGQEGKGHHDEEEHDHHKHDHGEHGHKDDHDHEAHDHEAGDPHHHDAEETDHGHDHEHHQHEDGTTGHGSEQREDLEITSLLIKFKNPMALVQLPRFINENTSMQAALPAFEIQRLLGLLGAGFKTINGIAFAILVVSGFSIFIGLLKTMRERRKELAVLRTYGLGTGKLLSLALWEGVFLAILGCALGWFLGRLALWIASKFMESTYGYGLELTGPSPQEWWLFASTLIITFVAALLAAISVFKLNIAKTLSDA